MEEKLQVSPIWQCLSAELHSVLSSSELQIQTQNTAYLVASAMLNP